MSNYFIDKRLILSITTIWIFAGLFFYALKFTDSLILQIGSSLAIFVFIYISYKVRQTLITEEDTKV